MDIYKRGQGVWARGFALLVFLLFAGWGVWQIYRIPAALNVIVGPDDVLWRSNAERLLENGKTRIRVKGLANQPVGDNLLEPGLKPGRRIEPPHSDQAILLEDEDFDRSRIQDLEDAGITHVPVLKDGKIVDSVEIDDWLVGRTLAEDVVVKNQVVFEDLATDAPLGEEGVTRIREALEDHPASRVGPLYRSVEAKAEGARPTFVTTDGLEPGMVPAGTLSIPVQEVIAKTGTKVDRDLFRRIREQKENLISPKVRIEDEGDLVLDPDDLDEIEGRYLRAKRSVNVQTWWSQVLFTVPLAKIEITYGILICVVLFVVLALALLATWNLRGWNDLLIDTQTEMKKVSWPKRDELIGSSVVVIVTVVVLGAYLYLVDFLLTAVARESGLLG